MARDDEDSFAPYALAALWRVIRAARAGRLTDSSARWIGEIVETVGARALFDSLVQFFDEEAAPIDLGRRAMTELPDDGEAHFVDSDSDLIAVLLVLTALRPGEFRRRAREIVAPLRYRRERIGQVAREMVEAERPFFGLGLPEGPTQAVTVIEEALDDLEAAEATLIRAAELRTDLVDAVVDAAQVEARESFPLIVLEARAALRFSADAPRAQLHEFRLTLERRMLVDDAPGDISIIGTHAGHLIAQYNQYLLEDALRAVPSRTWRLQSVQSRIVEAISRLAERGLAATDILAPTGDWVLRQELEQVSDVGPTSPRTLGGALLTFAQMRQSDSVYVLSLPAAVTWTIEEHDARWLRSSLDALEQSDDRLAQPKVVLSLFESNQVSLDRRAIFRIGTAEPRRGVE